MRKALKPIRPFGLPLKFGTWCVFALYGVVGHAQVATDGSLSGSAASLDGPAFDITSDLGRTEGRNLFHSFSKFDLRAGEEAIFSGPEHITNILSRVSGNEGSVIDGKISSTIAGANMVLVNRNGLIFGESAEVDVSGSFAATSADYIKLGEGSRFDSQASINDNLLSGAPPSAFGFLGNQAMEGAVGEVKIEGGLSVPNGSLVQLVGREVAVVRGEVNLSRGELHLRGGIDGEAEIGMVSASPGAGLDLGQGTGSGAELFIRAGKLVVENAAVGSDTLDGRVEVIVQGGVELKNGGRIRAANEIQVSADELMINGSGVEIAENTGTEISLGENATSDRAEIRLNIRNNVELVNGGQISTSSSGDSEAGDVSIRANNILLEGKGDDRDSRTGIFAESSIPDGASEASGGAGDIVLTANKVVVRDGARISTNTTTAGNGGDLTVQAISIELSGSGDVLKGTDGTGLFSKTTHSRGGRAGQIQLESGDLSIRKGAKVEASTAGEGAGGEVLIGVAELTIDGEGAASRTGVFVSSDDSSSTGGRAGDLQIIASRVDFRNGTVEHESGISTSTSGGGDAGNVDLETSSLILENGASISSRSVGVGSEGRAAGVAGRLSIRARDNLRLDSGSRIESQALHSDGGLIEIRVGENIEIGKSSVTAAAGQDGGSILIASTGDAGLVTFNGSVVSASAVFGDGGRIDIAGDLVVVSAESSITASSERGIEGQVDSDVLDVAGGALIDLTIVLPTEVAAVREQKLREAYGSVSGYVIPGLPEEEIRENRRRIEIGDLPNSRSQ